MMGEWHESDFDEESCAALLEHFGVKESSNLPLDHIRHMSPATLARIGGTNPPSNNLGPILYALDVAEIEK